jgi:hypothetical protein
MRKPFPPQVEAARIRKGAMGSKSGEGYGAFTFTNKSGKSLAVIAIGSDDTGWEHVSVSLKHRTPTWEEMCFIKDLFWGPEEEVVQFHPPRSEYVNCHPHCLHLWRHVDGHKIPPSILVGPR